MGSSSSGAERYADWTYTGFCSCPSKYYMCEYMKLEVVPMSSGFARGVTQFGKGVLAVATLGISTRLNGGVKSLEHDCVKLRVRCRNCGRIMNLTTEFSGSGVETRFGYYGYYYRIKWSDSIWVPYDTIMNILPKWRSWNYELVNTNCSHYAAEAYNRIIEAHNKYNS